MSRNRVQSRQWRRAAGFTLIEVLAAFVILSIGLLGIVSLQAVSKSAQYQAMQRARAVTLADDILERIRVNPTAVQTYSAAAALGGGELGDTPDTNCLTTACDPNALAAFDLWAWEQSLDGASETLTKGGVTTNAGGLVNPRGCIEFTPDAGKVNTGVISVIVQWQGLESTSDGFTSGDACGADSDFVDLDTRRRVEVSSYVYTEE